jgi:hypothetical protein
MLTPFYSVKSFHTSVCSWYVKLITQMPEHLSCNKLLQTLNSYHTEGSVIHSHVSDAKIESSSAFLQQVFKGLLY